MSVVNSRELPKGWVAADLGDVLKVIRGVTYRKEESRKTQESGFVPVLRATNIHGTLEFDDLVYVPQKNVSEIQTLRPADIVVAASSGSASVVGKAAQLKHEWAGSFGAFCFCLRPEPAIESRLLGWFLHTTEYRNRVSKAAAGVNINNLRAEHIEQTPFRIPPFGEQQRIADALDELLSDLDAGVAALERVQAKLKHYRAAVLKAAVEGALTAEWRAQHPATEPASALLTHILAERRRRWEEAQLEKFKVVGKAPPKDWKAKYKEPDAPITEGLPQLPGGWCWASLDQLAWAAGYGTSEKCRETSGGIAVLRIPNIIGGNIDTTNLKYAPPEYHESKDELVSVGDLLVVRTNGSRTLIGRGAVIRKEPTQSFSYASYLIRLRLVPLAPLLNWVSFLWDCAQVRQWIEKRAATSAGQHNISLSVLKTLVIPLPPVSEQIELTECLEDQLSSIEHIENDLEAKLKSAQALQQSILRHAFTGQLVPQDPEDEPAAKLLERIAAQREERARQLQAAKKAKTKAPPKRTTKKTRKTTSHD